MKVELDGNSLSIGQVEEVARKGAEVRIAEAAVKRVEANWRMLQRLVARGDRIYGVNTGIGAFGNEPISLAQGAELSKRMIRAHAAGVGNPLPVDEARACLLLRANTLAKGYSGVRVNTLQMFCELLNRGVTPVICEKGSVGTSGDLAPLAQMSLVLMGEGEAFFKGVRMSGAEALQKAGLMPLELEAREGLALFNGAQTMSAIGCLALLDAERLLKTAQIASAMTVDSLNAVTLAFDERLHALRPYPGQIAVAGNLRRLIEGSEILQQKKTDTQSAYSLRCIPQVLGASRDALSYVRRQLEVEINSAADNPIFITDDECCLAGGNFHGQPIAIAMDLLGIAVAEIGDIAERRVNRLLNPALNGGLPAFLIGEERGLNSGLMIAQYTAAALVSENKILSSPAVVDSIPCSADQEDHVSMGTIGARKARDIVRNVEYVVAIELLCAAQAMEFRQPLKAGKGTQVAYEEVRKEVAALKEDRVVYPEIEKVRKLVMEARVLERVEAEMGALA
ncbi:Histidine ammonia-lyase [uncultured archaeon]|nr:Histidine ammonia-lyase [uncultured archaeon]